MLHVQEYVAQAHHRAPARSKATKRQTGDGQPTTDALMTHHGVKHHKVGVGTNVGEFKFIVKEFDPGKFSHCHQ